ncbi:protein N-terminal asparagine amidohydrolase [Cyprinodon tularosa]|uniref:protein N-terminal asparagine amidohydrolase n=1 Tax=Cyprinodon tularosa TaxID=77115 RepID=UPI0018E27B58|nr:protein N-terminal asparagine amidohydrolase [Cyprinodon tularosa]
MPLLFQNRELGRFRSTTELFHKYPDLQENAKAFRSKPPIDVDPKTLLYVQQREFAATTPADKCVSVFGSEDATTCHLVVLRHTGSGAVCLAHCDDFRIWSQIARILKAVKSLSNVCNEGRFELHVVGGFDDDTKTSQKISLDILAAFQRQEEDIHLETCCITEMNDVVKEGIHRPIIYGIGVNVKTGEVFPASFSYKGPAEDLRSARILTGGEMADIYDSSRGLVKIGPCHWTPDRSIESWLTQSDDIVLKNLSTSPMAEPPHFVQHMKSTIQFLLSHPNSESLFPGGQPQLYHRTESGTWERLVQS